MFAPNVRGSSGFGKTFVNLDNGALRVNAIRDIRSCADHVVKIRVADPQRIGIMGGSYGGYMTMAGLAEYPELFAAAVNLYGRQLRDLLCPYGTLDGGDLQDRIRGS